MTPEQRARLDAWLRRDPGVTTPREDIRAALAHIDALEPGMTRAMTAPTLTLADYVSDLRAAKEQAEAERDTAKAERLVAERQHYDDVARLEAERDRLREALVDVRRMAINGRGPTETRYAIEERCDAALAPPVGKEGA